MPGFLITLKNIIKETPPARAYRRKKYDAKLATPDKIEKAIKLYMGDNVSPKEHDEVAEDIIKTAKQLRFDAEEYFFFNFRSKTFDERRAFIPDREGMEIRALLNKGKNREIFDNKWEAYQRFKKYYKRDACLVKTENDKEEFSKLLSKHGSLIIKPLVDGCGHGVKRVEMTGDESKLFCSLLGEIKGGFIAEELIKQVPDMAQFHPNSVNTIRITTIRFPDKVLKIHPFMRMGTGGNVVDNGGAGGLICTIRPESGVIYSAVDEACVRYEKHPFSGKQIIGFEVPRWDEAMSLAEELSSVVPDNRYTGWDLALTEKGWIMVEGNASGMFVGWQLNDQVGFRSEMEGYLKELGIKNN